ncbi:hypothetical protein FA048_14360 [Pedobacter polaris]|uniref:Uncharacterized protein n=1 Tax=Pedobacter polaris TaxID=2571273 RepID=A0A4U1CM41_9SPHI|nr:hypothetical protein [Pedobacter polaris]TKC08336.1 hypothetical protein FA048_14360 [Pedobacter polaris]
MKKFIIAFAIVFIVNLGCKKIIDQPVCACSPVSTGYLNLVVKNAAGNDLLNSNVTGSFAQNQIQLYAKDANGNIKQINFSIRPPITFNAEKFNYHQLLSQEIAILAKSIDHTFYLKLGNQLPYEINLQVSSNLNKVEKVLIDKKEAPKDTGKIATDLGLTIYHLNI